MGRYSYCCDKCDYVFDAYHKPEHRLNTESCPMCGSPAHYSFKETIKDSKHDALIAEHERWSWSMGVNRQDVAEAMKKYPGSEYDHRGRLRIKNRQHKLFELRRRGMEEF
jgi:hypothetical protein